MSEFLERTRKSFPVDPLKSAAVRSGRRTPIRQMQGQTPPDENAAFICPVFRRGQIIQAWTTDRTTNAEVPLRRSAEQAFALGKLVASELDSYYAAIESAVSKYVKKSNRELTSFKIVEKPDGNNTSLKFAPGMIIDFPEHDFVIDGITFRERSCITVCRDTEPSKVWTRFVFISNRTGEVSTNNAKKFYTIGQELSSQILNNISRVYLKNFNRMLQEFNESSARFKKIAELDFYGFDNREIGNLIKDGDEEQKLRLSEWISVNCKNVLPFEPKTKLGRDILKAKFNAVKVSTGEDEYESTYAYFLNYTENRAVFLVAGEPNKKLQHEMDSQKLNKGYGVSQSLTVINDLANRIAGQF